MAETIKNLYTALTFKSLDHELVSNMVAKLLNVNAYNYNDTQERIRQEEQDKNIAAVFSLQPPTFTAKASTGASDPLSQAGMAATAKAAGEPDDGVS